MTAAIVELWLTSIVPVLVNALGPAIGPVALESEHANDVNPRIDASRRNERAFRMRVPRCKASASTFDSLTSQIVWMRPTVSRPILSERRNRSPNSGGSRSARSDGRRTRIHRNSERPRSNHPGDRETDAENEQGQADRERVGRQQRLASHGLNEGHDDEPNPAGAQRHDRARPATPAFEEPRGKRKNL